MTQAMYWTWSLKNKKDLVPDYLKVVITTLNSSAHGLYYAQIPPNCCSLSILDCVARLVCAQLADG